MEETNNIDNPKLSIVVNFYNMRREAARTLYTLSSKYQCGVNENLYEVLVIENGSTQPLTSEFVSSFGKNFRYHYYDTKSRSPIGSINETIKRARSEQIMVMIDGAHMLSPGVVRNTLSAMEIFKKPFVTVVGFHIGPKIQNQSVDSGYNQQEEDKILASVNWQENGYFLFKVAGWFSYDCAGWFSPLAESNCFTMNKAEYNEVGGLDSRFIEAGGGFAILDLFRRVMETPELDYVVLLGEGTFHQFHGGIASNQPYALHPWNRFHEEYRNIRKRDYQIAPRRPFYFGSIGPEATYWSMLSAHVGLAWWSEEGNHDLDEFFPDMGQCISNARIILPEEELFTAIKQRDEQNFQSDRDFEKLLNAIKQKDAEIKQLEERVEEIWKAREWFSSELQTILNSKKYRFINHLNELRLFRNIRYNAKEIIKIILAGKYVQKIREFRNQNNLAAHLKYKFLYTYFRIRRSFTKPVRYNQNHYEGPLVSLISPCFNYGRYLDRFLECLQEQTFKDFEVILIDDGSTDKETVDKIKEIEEREIPNIKIIRQENMGVIAARNRAISEAKGKYIFPFDPDDTVDKTFLEKCLLYLESSPPHYFVHFWTYSIGDSDFIWETYDGDPIGNLEENRVGFITFPKEQFYKIGGYNPIMKDGYEDWEFCVNLMRSGYAGKVIPEPLYNYFVKAEARNYAAIKKHELLKKIINDLHKDHIYKNWKKLKRIRKKRYCVTHSLINLVDESETLDKEYCIVDLYNKKFNPAWTFHRILCLADSMDKNIIVALDNKWRNFFDLNSRPNLFVYCPENYHNEGDVSVFYEYVERRYSPRHLDVVEIDAKGKEIEDQSGKINILYVAPWLITGGSDAMTIDWFRKIGHENFNKYFVTTLPRYNTWIYKIRGYADEIYELPSLQCKDDKDIEQFLLDFIERRNIHVVHIMNSQIGFKALPLLKARFPRVTTVAQFHCFDYLEDGERVGYPHDIPMRYDNYIDFYNVVSHALKNEILELFPYINEEKFKIIYCCVDTDKFRPDWVQADTSIIKHRCSDRLNILFIGRLDRQKQPIIMAKVAHELKILNLPFVIHVLGEASLESQKRELLRFIDENDLSEDIILHGDQPLESMASWYQVGDVLLMTSAWEGIPVVLYEAMSMQVVCVAPDVGGIRELLKDDYGYLIKDRKDIQSYVNALVDIGRNTKLRKALGKKARDIVVRKFDINVMKKDYQTFYKDIIR